MLEATPGKATEIQVLLKTISRNLYGNAYQEKPTLLPRNCSVLSLCKWAPVTNRVFIFLGLPAVRLKLGCTSGSPEEHLKLPSAQLLPR